MEHRGDHWTSQCVGLEAGVSGGTFFQLHVQRLTLAISWNTYTWPLHVVSLHGLVWGSSQHGGWVPRVRQKHRAFLWSCLTSHSVTSIILCSLRQSQRSAEVQEEGIQAPPTLTLWKESQGHGRR